MIITALKNYRLDELQENTDQFIVEILKEDSRQFAFDHAIGRLYDTVSYQLNENGVSSIDYLDKVIVLERVKQDRKSTRLNSSHVSISYAVFCLKQNIRSRLI